MPVKQRVATWVLCGAFCAASTGIVQAQERSIRQHPVETAVVPQSQNNLPRDEDIARGEENTRVPVRNSDDDGLGLRLGSFVLSSSYEAGIDYTDNVFSTNTDKTSDRIYSLNSSLGLVSDWSRHFLVFSLDATREVYEKNSSEDNNSLTATGQLRIDIRRDTTLDLRVGLGLDQEDRGSVDLNDTASEPSDIYSLNASATLNHRINRMTMSLRGGIEAFDYEDTPLASGAVEDNSDRNYYQVSSTLRVGYDISPRLIVFSELNYAETTYERRVDNNGDISDSHSYGASAGVTFQFSALLNGEISIGYREAVFDDPGFDNVDALVVNASLNWTPSELTEITANFATDLGETTLGGSSGSLTRTASINMTHAWRENIELNASASIEYEDFSELSLDETTYNVSFGVDYDLGRKMTLGARYSYEKFDSSTAGNDYETNTVGVRLTYTD